MLSETVQTIFAAMTAYRKFGPSTEHAQNASFIGKILD
eukprot:COSAG01_NODE_20191_length_966_cov_1.177624_2_plen_37_part_01